MGSASKRYYMDGLGVTMADVLDELKRKKEGRPQRPGSAARRYELEKELEEKAKMRDAQEAELSKDIRWEEEDLMNWIHCTRKATRVLMDLLPKLTDKEKKLYKSLDHPFKKRARLSEGNQPGST